MVQNILMAILILALPFLVGSIFRSKSISFTYLAGQLTMWAVFQMAAVPAVHLRTSFTLLFWVYSAVVLLLAGWGLKRRIKIGIDKPEISLFLAVAAIIIAYQCCVYIFGMHLDEDDARWIAEANDALVKDKMLLHNPATGEYIGHFAGEMVKDAFSPWAFYIAWMSRLTGIRAATMAHTVYPPVLLILGYLAYWETGCQLFKGKVERGVFLLMVTLINMFLAGNAYTQSVFALTRIWQGKAVVASVMIPSFLAIFLKAENDNSISIWLCMAIASTACCLFSGMGIAIAVIVVTVYGLYAVIRAVVREWKSGLYSIPLWVLSLTPAIIYGIGYFSLKG